MQLETSIGAMRDAFGVFKGVIEHRNTVPILGYAMIGNGTIVGTNLDMEVTAKLAGRIKGKTCLPWKQIAAMLAHSDPADELKINESDGIASFGFNGAIYKFPTLPSSDFPDFNSIKGPVTQIGNAGLIRALKSVHFAVSTEETRYYLNGVCFSTNTDGKPVVVATDGHRLASHPLPFEVDGSNGKILPRFAVDYLLSRKADPATCLFGETACCFDWPGLTLKSKLINGTYPDWHRVCPPGDTNAAFNINPAKWLPALKRMFAMAGHPKQRAVKLTVDHAGCVAELISPEHGECIERLPCSSIYGDPHTVGFNIRYLIEVIEAFKDCDEIIANGDGAGSPHRFTSNDSDLTVILMPMRV